MSVARLDAPATPNPSASVHPVIRRYQPPEGLRERIAGALLRTGMRLGVRPFFGPPWPYAVQRLAIELGARMMPQDGRAEVSHDRIGAMKVERIRPKGVQQSRHVLLYLHGGGFIAGSPRSHRSITRRLAALTGATVVVPDYRLAPEGPFPAQIEDCLQVYEQLLAEGYAPERIAIAGDSAGGTLTFMTACVARDKGLPLPAALVMLSPALLLAEMLEAHDHPKAHRDPVIRLSLAQSVMKAMRAPMDHPWAQPKTQNLADLPPTLIQVGEDEVLYESAAWAIEVLTAAGRPAELEVYLKRWHVFQIHAALLPSASRALARQAEFIQRHWAP